MTRRAYLLDDRELAHVLYGLRVVADGLDLSARSFERIDDPDRAANNRKASAEYRALIERLEAP